MLLLTLRFSVHTVSLQHITTKSKMDSDSTDLPMIEFDFSMKDLFSELKGINNNMVDIENHTIFSSHCGSFPDLEKVRVSY